jgi:hypothetical protein
LFTGIRRMVEPSSGTVNDVGVSADETRWREVTPVSRIRVPPRHPSRQSLKTDETSMRLRPFHETIMKSIAPPQVHPKKRRTFAAASAKPAVRPLCGTACRLVFPWRFVAPSDVANEHDDALQCMAKKILETWEAL